MQNAIPIGGRYEEIAQSIIKRIANEPDAFILGTLTNDLVEYYCGNYQVAPIELDPERAETVDIKKIKRIIPADQRDPVFRYQGNAEVTFEYLNVQLPILPHAQIEIVKRFEPSRYDSGFAGEELCWIQDALSFDIVTRGYDIRKTDDGIKKEVDQSIQWVKNRLQLINYEMELYYGQLKTKIAENINNRKRILEQDKERHASLLQKINIPIRLKQNEAATNIRLSPKPLVTRIRPTPQQPEEYTLDESAVLDIIQFLDNQGRQFEKTPTTLLKMGEEDLRNNLLATLNSLFDGRATGETFCMKGKTDIYLQLDKGNILSFECKFWDGYKAYQDTIDQLLSYLTWRMNYGIIILFSRQKNFIHLLEEGKKAIQGHPSYQQNFQEIKNTHFRSYHRSPLDENRFVQIHHLFYTLTSP